MTTPGAFPKHAAMIWLEGESICLGLPGLEAGDKSHTVKLSLDKCSIEWNESGTAPLGRQMGWQVLLRVLQERVRVEAQVRELIGRTSNPTQFIIDEWLKVGGTVKKHSAEGHRIVSLEELGLETGEQDGGS